MYLDDADLREYHNKFFLTLDNNNNKIQPNLNNGLKISVDLSSKNEINAFVAKKNTPLLVFRKVKKHKIELYWESLKLLDKKLVIRKDNFYILRSKEKIQIPKMKYSEVGFNRKGIRIRSRVFILEEIYSKEAACCLTRARFNLNSYLSRRFFSDSQSDEDMSILERISRALDSASFARSISISDTDSASSARMVTRSPST